MVVEKVEEEDRGDDVGEGKEGLQIFISNMTKNKLFYDQIDLCERF